MKKMRMVLAGLIGIFLIIGNFSTAIAATDIGVAWAGKSGMANRVAKGFEKGMAEMAPDIKIEYQKDIATVEDLSKVADKWQKEKKAMVLLRSSAAKWLAKNPPSIPTFIGGCNNPTELGAVKNLDKPEGQITGVTYFLPIDTQFEIFKAILPNMQSVLLLLEEGHPSSAIDQEATKNITAKLGIAYNQKYCKSPADMAAAVGEFKGKVSAIIIGNQALLFDNTETIVKAADKTPVLSYSAKSVKSGALGGFAADDEKLGYMLAKSVVDVLKNGKAVKDVPVKVDPDPKFFLNAKSAQKLEIEVPFTILESATVIE